jgi:hypothetical protein
VTAPRPTSARPDWLVRGYRAALRRFDDTTGSRDPEERFIPIFEALNWAAAMLDPNSSLRASLITDHIVRGLRFARNRVHHDWAEAIEARDMPYPGGSGLKTVPAHRGARMWRRRAALDWCWKPLNQIPGANKRGAAQYRAHLEGKPARQALAHLDGLLPWET